MWFTRAVICGAVLACGAFCGQRMAAQEEVQDAEAWTPTVVEGAAFSAVTYKRTVRVQPDGKRIVVAEGHRMLVARDAAGRIFMEGVDAGDNGDDCDLPSLGKLPTCDYWELLLFDPKSKVMWDWSDGEIADKVQMGLWDLRDDLMADVVRETSVLERPNPPESGVTIQDLGEKSFGGIAARGVRTTVEQNEPDGSPGVRIHEVWTSVKMRLVLKTIDGDPKGEETVSGLLKISLAPDPSLFRPPSGKVVRHWKDQSRFGDSFVAPLSLWPVK
jgi:hypothetical protein